MKTPFNMLMCVFVIIISHEREILKIILFYRCPKVVETSLIPMM